MAHSNVHCPMEFIREPRLPAPPVSHGEFAVEGPPDIPKAVPGNPLARLLPVAMVVATVGMMALYFTSGGGAMRNPMFMFFPAMMLMSVVGTLAYGARGTNRTAELNRHWAPGPTAGTKCAHTQHCVARQAAGS